MKKLMLLGGSRYLINVIKKAQELGIYVITCDYLPDNIAHKYSDEYCNVSVIDEKAVLAVALEKKIDGIMSFACDPGVVTAAYVAEKMNLPFQGSYNAVKILQDKGLFREFLARNEFNVPKAKRYTDIEAALNDIDNLTFPIIVKPVDSAGSKGVTRVDNSCEFEKAIEIAMDNSHCKSIIVEDFIEFEGYHSSADVFTIDGELKFVTYSDQLFDKTAENPYTPAYIIWPSTMKKEYQSYLTTEIQRLMLLLNMRTGIYNIETCVAKNGKPYIMEISPRGGGCKIAELQKMAYGIDLIENEIKKAVGYPLGEFSEDECNGYWCEMVIHSNTTRNSRLKAINIASDIKEKYLKEADIVVKSGDIIHAFTGANMSLGDIFLRFNSRKELDDIIAKQGDWIKIELEEE